MNNEVKGKRFVYWLYFVLLCRLTLQRNERMPTTTMTTVFDAAAVVVVVVVKHWNAALDHSAFLTPFKHSHEHWLCPIVQPDGLNETSSCPYQVSTSLDTVVQTTDVIVAAANWLPVLNRYWCTSSHWIDPKDPSESTHFNACAIPNTSTIQSSASVLLPPITYNRFDRLERQAVPGRWYILEAEAEAHAVRVHSRDTSAKYFCSCLGDLLPVLVLILDSHQVKNKFRWWRVCKCTLCSLTI